MPSVSVTVLKPWLWVGVRDRVRDRVGVRVRVRIRVRVRLLEGGAHGRFDAAVGEEASEDDLGIAVLGSCKGAGLGFG